MVRNLLVIVLIVTSSGSAMGDPHPITLGADPRPTTQSDVVLAREDLDIEIRLRHVLVDASFRFENKGPAQKLDVGFPCAAGKWAADSGLTCRDRLEVRVNGRKVRVGRTKNKAKEHFRNWKMHFPAKASTELRLRYRTSIVNDRYSIPLAGMSLLRYRLVTGAMWAGPIGELNMRVTVPPDTLALIRPLGYQRAVGRVEWKLTNYEPREDLVIGFPMSAVSDFLHLYRAKKWRALKRNLASVKPATADIQRLAQSLLKPAEHLPRFIREQYMRLRPRPGGGPPEPREIRGVLAESAALLRRRIAPPDG